MILAPVRRRHVLAGVGGLGVAGLAGCATTSPAAPAPARPGFQPRVLAPLRMDMSRLTHMTVCLRPFRAAGPRLDVETVLAGGGGWLTPKKTRPKRPATEEYSRPGRKVVSRHQRSW